MRGSDPRADYRREHLRDAPPNLLAAWQRVEERKSRMRRAAGRRVAKLAMRRSWP